MTHIGEIIHAIERKPERHIELTTREVEELQLDAAGTYVASAIHGVLTPKSTDVHRDLALERAMAKAGKARTAYNLGISPNQWQSLQETTFAHPGFLAEDVLAERWLDRVLRQRSGRVQNVRMADTHADDWRKSDLFVDVDNMTLACQLTIGSQYDGKVDQVCDYIRSSEPDVFSYERNTREDRFRRDGYMIVALGGLGQFSDNEMRIIGEEWLQNPDTFISHKSPRRRHHASYYHKQITRIEYALDAFHILLTKNRRMIDDANRSSDGGLRSGIGLMGTEADFCNIETQLPRSSEVCDWTYDPQDRVMTFSICTVCAKRTFVRSRDIPLDIDRSHKRPIRYLLDHSSVIKVGFVLTDQLLDRFDISRQLMQQKDIGLMS